MFGTADIQLHTVKCFQFHGILKYILFLLCRFSGSMDAALIQIEAGNSAQQNTDKYKETSRQDAYKGQENP